MQKNHATAMRYLALTACFFACQVTQASMLQKLSTKQLTKNSSSVRVGKVVSQWSSYDPQKRMVFTYTKLKVSETIKGTHRSEVLIRQAGGESNGLGMRVHGVASFEEGESAVVFLRQDKDGAPTLTGMAQGRYRIFPNQKGETTAEFVAPKNVEFFQTKRNSAFKFIKKSVNRRLPLKELLGEIRLANTP